MSAHGYGLRCKLLPCYIIANSILPTEASAFSTNELLAELQRRQKDGERPQCGGKGRGWYDMTAHVFALFLILALSTLCMHFPSDRYSKQGREKY